MALPSVNPAFLPPDHPWAGEHRVADFVAATGAKAGLDVDLQEVAPGRSNVLLRLCPRGRTAQRVVLAPHLDTVNGTDDQFVPRLQNGRLSGRGACDTKGSVAAMLGALAQLARQGSRPATTEIVLAGLLDEENSQLGSRTLAASGLRADLAIVGEPTECKVVTAHKGSLWLSLETRGRSAHGSTPHLGRNAIRAMARVVEFMESAYPKHLEARTHPLMGHPTSSVGVIRGGSQANIVPDRCVVEVDRRTLPGETERSVLKELKVLLRSAGLSAGVESIKSVPCPSLETNPDLPLVRSLLKSVRQQRPFGAHYFCDAAVLAEAGMPSVVFGPGSIAQAHTADEWIDLDSLETAQRSLIDFLCRLP